VPEIQDGLDLKSSKSFKEIWPHTIRVVGQAPPHLNVRWAALFHDLGKAQAFEIKNNKVTFYNHEFISSRIFSGFALYTGIFSGGQRRAIRFLISHLGYVENYSAQWTDSAVRRFDKEIGIYLDDLLTLSEADITTGRPENRRKILGRTGLPRFVNWIPNRAFCRKALARRFLFSSEFQKDHFLVKQRKIWKIKLREENY
jgi:putative nucleotidyltransferase with HDIG domain